LVLERHGEELVKLGQGLVLVVQLSTVEDVTVTLAVATLLGALFDLWFWGFGLEEALL